MSRKIIIFCLTIFLVLTCLKDTAQGLRKNAHWIFVRFKGKILRLTLCGTALIILRLSQSYKRIICKFFHFV